MAPIITAPTGNDAAQRAVELVVLMGHKTAVVEQVIFKCGQRHEASIAWSVIADGEVLEKVEHDFWERMARR